MSDTLRKNRNAYRPSLREASLEDRVVLNGSAATAAHGTLAAQVSPLATSTSALGNLTPRQIRVAYHTQLLAARDSLRQFVDTQIATLYSNPSNVGSNGRLTPQALSDLKAEIGGALNATTLRLSAQASILPGSSRRVIPVLQNSLLGNGRGSLTRQIDHLIDSGRFVRSQAMFQHAINRLINHSFAVNAAGLNVYLNHARLNRLSIDPTTGQRVSLSRYVGTQALNQINNTFGTLANNVGRNAQSSLFDTAGNYLPQAASAFQQQYANALGTAAFQVGSILSLFPNANATLGPQLQSSVFGTGTSPITSQPTTSFVNGLANVLPSSSTSGSSPYTLNAFNTGFQGSFTNAYQNFTTPLTSFFGGSTTPGSAYQLPTGFFQNNANFPSLYGSQYIGSTFNNGFNNGFAPIGSGFPGYGTAPTGFNTGYGTGFNNYIGTANSQYGFTMPNYGTGLPTTIGTGLPTGSGTGLTTGIGTGLSTGSGTGFTSGNGTGLPTLVGTNTSGSGTSLLGTGSTLVI